MGFDFDREQEKELRRIGIDGDIKLDNVDRIIDMRSPAPPKRSFDIEVASQNKAVNKIYLGAALSGLAGDVFVYFLRRGATGDNDGLLEVIIGAVSIVFLVLAVCGGKGLVHVTGEELRVDGKSFFACDIERISCKGVDVIVISGGKNVLKLKKTDNGCDELMKWARAYNVDIENSGGDPTGAVKVLMIVGAVLFVAAFTALLFFIVTKM